MEIKNLNIEEKGAERLLSGGFHLECNTTPSAIQGREKKGDGRKGKGVCRTVRKANESREVGGQRLSAGSPARKRGGKRVEKKGLATLPNHGRIVHNADSRHLSKGEDRLAFKG